LPMRMGSILLICCLSKNGLNSEDYPDLAANKSLPGWPKRTPAFFLRKGSVKLPHCKPAYYVKLAAVRFWGQSLKG
jgi:hypothetical protein